MLMEIIDSAFVQASFCMQALVSLETVLQLLPGNHCTAVIGPLHDAVLQSTGDESTYGPGKVGILLSCPQARLKGLLMATSQSL